MTMAWRWLGLGWRFPPGITNSCTNLYWQATHGLQCRVSYARKEIPYSTQVVIEEYKEEEKIIRIRALIFVERKTQKGILIGHQGSKLKQVGISARKDIEKFVGKQVFLETIVKVDDDWRTNENKLEKYGY